jgi:hypothetical protein
MGLTRSLNRTGRWRSTYTLSSPSATQVEGDVNVLIHYFEEGNVQLNSSKSEQLSISGDSSEEARGKAIVKAIEGFESKYQEELYNTCNELGDGAFKSLRRLLPMTKQKMDWDRVSLGVYHDKEKCLTLLSVVFRYSTTTSEPNWGVRDARIATK